MKYGQSKRFRIHCKKEIERDGGLPLSSIDVSFDLQPATEHKAQSCYENW